MPCQAGAERNAAFECLCQLRRTRIVSRPAHAGIENQQDAAVVFPRKLAHLQFAGARCHFPVYVPGAVRRLIIAQRIQVLAVALARALNDAFERRQSLPNLLRSLNRRIDQRLGAQVHSPRLLQEPERKARHDPERSLLIDATPRKLQRNDLLRAAPLGHVREINRSFQHRPLRALFIRRALHAQRKRGQINLLVFELN